MMLWPCSCGKTLAHLGTASLPTPRLSPRRVSRFGSRSSSACWPPPHPQTAAGQSPSATACGRQAQRGSSSQDPPSALGPRCPPRLRVWSQTPWLIVMLTKRPWPFSCHVQNTEKCLSGGVKHKHKVGPKMKTWRKFFSNIHSLK